jgi:hypothetical protein
VPAIFQKPSSSVDDLIDELKPLGRGTPMTAAPIVTGFASPKKRPRLRPAQSAAGPWMIRAYVGLGVLLSYAITLWPYGNSCGVGLFFYSAVVALVLATGICCMMLTWNNRLGWAHLIALGILLWGTALVAHVVAPRVGYAAQSATWRCVN